MAEAEIWKHLQHS